MFNEVEDFGNILVKSKVKHVFLKHKISSGGYLGFLLLTGVKPIDSLWPGGLVKMGHFNTILTSPKSWLSQEDLDAGCEHSLVPMDS